ncbi:hypothetical protein DPMN_057154 [Dreissena polymorpha]|uniref:Uncharacterized protein n=1 Tax=Dreissena polymorpha TaxID=45954 RepID=A0A9D4CT05_DREPO|nr:hypothetical protein DPMN_057154 [Dreissena polymorpha]
MATMRQHDDDNATVRQYTGDSVLLDLARPVRPAIFTVSVTEGPTAPGVGAFDSADGPDDRGGVLLDLARPVRLIVRNLAVFTRTHGGALSSELSRLSCTRSLSVAINPKLGLGLLGLTLTRP